MTKTKVSLKGKVITIVAMPILLPLMLPNVLKTAFYGVSLLTESIGAQFEKVDVCIVYKSQKFFKWVRSV